MIRGLEDLAKEVLEIHNEKDTSQIWRDDHVRRAVADYREYQQELDGMDFNEDQDDCLGGGCKL